jgi:hypothetical protein
MSSKKKIIKEEVVPEARSAPERKKPEKKDEQKKPTGASQTRAHSITLTKINDTVVKPVKTGKEKDTRLPKGFKMFPEPYPNVGIIAKKKSGKTNVVVNIVKACADKDTHVFVLASTANKDPMFLALKKWCKKHEIPYHAQTEIKTVDELGKKQDFFEKFMREMGEGDSEEDETESEDEEAKHPRMSNYGQINEESCSDTDYSSSEDDEYEKLNYGKKFDRQDPKFIKNKGSIQPKKPYITPEVIIITDDLSNELKTPSLRAFFKRNRHYRCLNIVSTQWLQDLLPESLKQFDNLLLFKGLTLEKLEKVKDDADLSIDIDRLSAIYRSATERPFSFLYIDTRLEQYRRNFNERYNVPVTDEEWH